MLFPVGEGEIKKATTLVESWEEIFSDRGSTPLASTKKISVSFDTEYFFTSYLFTLHFSLKNTMEIFLKVISNSE